MTHSFQPSPTELALKWPPQAEDRFAALFAQALQGNKAAVWLQDPAQPTGILRPLGTFGIAPEERPMLEQARIDINLPGLGHAAQQGEFIQLMWTRDRLEMGETERLLMEAYSLDTLLCCALRLPDHTLGLIYAATEGELVPSTQQIVRAAQVAEALTMGLHRNQLKAEATQTREELQHILEQSPDLIITRTGSTYTSVNGASEEILGYRPEEMVGRRVEDFVHPEDLQRTIQTIQAHLQRGIPIRHFRCRFVHKNGQAVHLSWNSATRRGDRVVSIARDITELVQAEERIRESETRFQMIANSAPVMLWMMDTQQQCTFFNQSWLTFRGRTLEQELGWGWNEGVHPEDNPSCTAEFLRCWNQQVPYEVEFRMLDREGNYRWVMSRGVPRFGPRGEFLGFIGGCLDTHDRKVFEQQLQERELELREVMRLQKQFMRDAAHELRTPLAAIQGNLDILLRHRSLPADDREDILSDVRWESVRLGRLVNDMLILARGDAGLEFTVEELELSSLLLEVWEREKSSHPSHQFQLGDLQQVQLPGDRMRLQQLFEVLLENALRYTPAGGQIHLSVQGHAGLAEFRLSDTGIGIGREHLEKVFERFYRVDQARQRGADPGGTGLGLPIARWIVEQHEGKIWLESESEPGQGTTVVVQLPLH